jgi:hypothetical protein
MEKTKKVIPILFGGLGNQLFIYAAAKRLSMANDAELVLDDTSGFKRDFLYRRSYQLDKFNIKARKATLFERLEPFSRLGYLFLRYINSFKSFQSSNFIIQHGMHFDSRLLQKKVNNYLYLSGYWQSEDYFKDIENVIREELKITPPTDSLNLKMASKIKKTTSVAIHFRFFDNPEVNCSNNVEKSYYDNAICKMREFHKDAHYFIFSDQPDTIKENIPLSKNEYTIVNHNHVDESAVFDLWLMSQCDHFIIANSTFSWWGAWLSLNEEKIIFAPGVKLKEDKTSWGFLGLIPVDWIKI